MATLRNPEATKWDPDRVFERLGLGSPFPRKITFADVDFEIEINGQFLVIEAKRPWEEPTLGQARALDARVRQGRVCLVIYGDPDSGRLDAMRVWHPDGTGRKWPFSWEDLWNYCHEWATWAETLPKPMVRTPSFILREAANG